MTIPDSQFYLYSIDGRGGIYQTYEEALKEACRIMKSSEFVDCTPDESIYVTLYFPNADEKLTIRRHLFTYNQNIPLVTHIQYDRAYNKNYKNIGK